MNGEHDDWLRGLGINVDDWLRDLGIDVDKILAGPKPTDATLPDAKAGVMLAYGAGGGDKPTGDASKRAPGPAAPAPSPKSPGRASSGPRSATFEVTWAEDSDRFYARVLAAVMHDGAFRGISADQFNAISTDEPQPLMTLVADFHEAYAMRHSDRSEKQKLKIQFSADYNPQPEMWSSSLTGKKLSLVEQAPPAKPAAPQAAPTATASSGVIKSLARMAAEADRGGWAGFAFAIKDDGRGPVVMSMEKVKPQSAPAQGMAVLTESAASQELQAFLETIAGSKGQWEGHFGREAKSGAMHLMKWSRGADAPIPPPPPPAAPHRPLSKAEQFERETGMVYPQRVNKRLHDVGGEALKQANPFSLKNLPFTILGVVVPMGAMKVLMMDTNELGQLVRIEWQLDESVIEESAAARQATKEPVPQMRDLKPGDIIELPQHGKQRVVDIKPGKLVTEPVTAETSSQSTSVPAAPKGPAPKDSIKPVEGKSGKDVLTDYPAKKHVFEGDADGGYHSKARPATSNAKQLEVIQNPRKGVYKIEVEIRDANGQVITTKQSTMFPDDMTEKEVLDEVYAVMLEKHKTAPLPPPDANNDVLIEGVSPRGLKIRVVLKSDGAASVLVTFHPKR